MARRPAAKSSGGGALPHLLWKKTGGDYLLTNDSGHHAWLKKKDFAAAAAGRLPGSGPLFSELSSKGFIRGRLDFNDLAAKWRQKNLHLNLGPSLHILVLTLRCNHKCLYCQSVAAGPGAKDTDMAPATARKCVDFALCSPAAGITLEFQGGEPLLNWPALRETVRYARKKAKARGKDLRLALVSNFSLLDEKKAEFLLANEVSICTSLDGPKDLHNRNRPFSGADSHGATLKWLRYFQKRYAAQAASYRVFKPSALLTVSKHSLSRHREIIDEYVKAGLEDIFIRPLAPIGYAKNCWGAIGYSVKDFSAFYLKCLDYILKLNRDGVVIREKTAALMLEKIVNFRDPGYLDASCPCGAAVGQIAYNYNGDLYTCDEGRMLGWSGDDLFKLGSVFNTAYKKAVSGGAARVCAVSSNLEAQPACARCAYSPYCGVCPVYNYAAQGSLWGNMPSNDRCGLFKGIFDALFALLKKPASAAILKKWVAEK